MTIFRVGFLIALSCWFTHINAQTAPEVSVESGKIRGVKSDGLYIYRGIPYAQPPVGDLRWKPPQPAKPWKDVRDASKFGAECLQPIPNPRPNGIQFAEDCLYLNIFRPSNAQGSRLPVLVWFHGTPQGWGLSSTVPAENLARQGVIVVTFNYRMGRAGFFAHPALGVEVPNLRGNYGYMDQIAVLEWVQHNIGAFDGSPSNVTVGGASFGAGSVQVMLGSPLAHGLFQGAILHSPVFPTARAPVLPLRDITAAEKQAAQLVQSLGIEGSIQDVLNGMRKIAPTQLANGADSPMIDGNLIPETLEAVFQSGEFARVPLLIGTTESELPDSGMKSKTVMFAQFGKLAPKARALYDPDGERSLDDLVQTLVTDRNVHEPARYVAESVTATGFPAYMYRFAYVNEAKREKMARANHGSELPFIFDDVASYFGKSATEDDIEMGHLISAYWVSFIKTGSPNGGGRPSWDKFDRISQKLMMFTNSGAFTQVDPLRERLDLWQEIWENPSASK